MDLKTYTLQKFDTIQVGGISVDIGGGRVVPLATDTASQNVLGADAALAKSDPSLTFQYTDRNGEVWALSSYDVIVLWNAVQAFFTALDTTYHQVIFYIDKLQIRTTEQVDNPPAPVQPWPVNS